MDIFDCFDTFISLCYDNKGKIVKFDHCHINRLQKPYVCFFDSMNSVILNEEIVLHFIQTVETEKSLKNKELLYELYMKVLRLESNSIPETLCAIIEE